MSNVLVDRELPEQIVNTNTADYAVIAYQHKEIRSILARPAEEEGVKRWALDVDCLYPSEEGGWCEYGDHLTALSAVTAERDRLLEEKGDPSSSFEKCMQAMRDRDEHAKTIDQLRAEVEALMKWKQTAEYWYGQYRLVKHGESPEQYPTEGKLDDWHNSYHNP